MLHLRAALTAAFVFVATLSAAPSARAGTISAELNRTEGEIGESFALTVFVEGNLDGEVQIPEVTGLIIRRTGYKQSINIVNGQTYPEISLIFSIHPQQSGTFSIPGISATIDGKKESTVPLALSIKAAGQSSSNPQAQAPQSGKGSQQRQQPGAGGKRPHEDTGGIFIERECATDTPYVGEQVVCAVRVHHRDNLVGGQRMSQNSADVRRFNAEGERRYARVINGQRYGVIELREILVAKKSGDLDVPPFALQARVLTWSRRNNPLDKFFDNFGGGAFNFDFNFTEEKDVTIKSEPQILKVKPLPEDGKPAGFNGIVGQYNLTASINKNKLPAGETVTITIELTGEGILDSVPDLKPTVDTLGRVYADKPEYKEEVEANRGIRSSKTFKYALVPSKPGEYQLGVIEVPVFNPKLNQYTVLRSDLGTLIVEPGAAEEKPVVVGVLPVTPDATKQDVKVLGQDLLAPHRNLDLRASHELTGRDWAVLAALGGSPMAMALGLMGAGLVRARRGSNPAQQKRARALRSCVDAMRIGVEHCAQGRADAGLSQAHRAFRAYLGDKLDLAGGALTSREVDAQLQRIGFGTESRLKLADLLARFEKVEFGGRAPAADEAARWIHELAALVQEIDPKC
jgi:hypothetical protein